ncbi:MAG: choice-of-anchor Q domain-containing protein [Solirubrobacterales bacterium]
MQIVGTVMGVSHRLCAMIAIAAVAIAATAATAAADDYCVGSTPLCNASVIPATGDGFAAALTSSNSHAGADRIFLAPGTYDLETGIAETVPSGQSLQIIGAGSASTSFTCQPAAVNACFSLSAPSSASSLSGVTAKPSGTASNVYGLVLTRADGSDLAVVDPGGMSAFRAIAAYYGTAIDGCHLTLASSNAVGLFTNNADFSATHCSVQGGSTSTGVSAGGNNTTVSIDHSSFRDVQTGLAMTVGTLNVSDTLIDMGSAGSRTGIDAYYPNAATGATTLNADRVTIVGSGTTQYGTWLGAVGTGQSFAADIEDSVIYNPAPGFVAIHSQFSPPSGASDTIATKHTAYNLAGVVKAGTAQVTPTNENPIDLASTPPGFVDPATRNYHLAVGSTLIDAGGSTTAAGATDLDGAARVVDGNGDGNASVDIGAYEFQPPAPGGGADAAEATARIVAKPKKSFRVGRKAGFGKARKGAASFSVKFANSAKAKFTLKSIGRHNKLKTVKGSQTLNVSDGTIKIGMRGRWNKKQLRAGKYRVTITPISGSGVAGDPVSVRIALADRQ